MLTPNTRLIIIFVNIIVKKTMGVYRLDQSKFNELRNRTLIKTIPQTLISIVGAVFISKYSPSLKNIENSDDIMYILIPLLLFILGMGIFSSVKRIKGIFENYTLRITTDEISVQQNAGHITKIAIGDVSKITKNYNGSYTIVGKTTFNLIPIFAQVENKEMLEIELNNISSIVLIEKKTLLEKSLTLLSLLTIILMATVFISENKIVVGISGFLLSVMLLWSFVRVRKSDYFDEKIKRYSFFGLLILIAIIVNTILKLAA